jgi:Putative zinc-finger
MHFHMASFLTRGLARGTGVMSCKDTIHLICWYLEGKLSPSVSLELQKHLGGCSNCQLVLDAATSTLEQYFGPNRSAASPEATRAA